MTHLQLHDKAHAMCCIGLLGSGNKRYEQPQPSNLKPADVTLVKLQLP
jgi:hypothetical protein